MFVTEKSHELMSHFLTPSIFLPDNTCLVCSESSFWRPFSKNMWYIDGDKHVPKECCDGCKCYVEGAYFYNIMRGIPKCSTSNEVFRDAYYGSESLVRDFHYLDAQHE